MEVRRSEERELILLRRGKEGSKINNLISAFASSHIDKTQQDLTQMLIAFMVLNKEDGLCKHNKLEMCTEDIEISDDVMRFHVSCST
jgi:hypothetical protein